MKENHKQQIMATALAMFANQGYNSTSVADIMQETGVARGTFYYYFKDKHDLLEQLLETNFTFIKSLFLSKQNDLPTNVKEMESFFYNASLQMVNHPNSRNFMTMMISDARISDMVFIEKINRFYDDLAEVFCAYIELVQKKGLIDKRDPKILSYFILGAIREIFIQWANGDRFGDLRFLISEVTLLIIHGANPARKDGPN
jgi:AcrR family transcriptional regulator